MERLLARPLGWQDWDTYRDSDYQYVYDSLGATPRFPTYRMRLSGRDLARFGQLYLQEGAWNGRQILPRDWVRRSTSPIVKVDETGKAYGYLWWTTTPDAPLPGVPADAYSARGLGGQFVTVIPSLAMVAVGKVDPEALGFKAPPSGYAREIVAEAIAAARAARVI